MLHAQWRGASGKDVEGKWGEVCGCSFHDEDKKHVFIVVEKGGRGAEGVQHCGSCSLCFGNPARSNPHSQAGQDYLVHLGLCFHAIQSQLIKGRVVYLFLHLFCMRISIHFIETALQWRN